MNFSTLVLDFETQSEADIKKVGSWNYSRHTSTKILVLSYQINFGPVRRWIPEREALPSILQTFFLIGPNKAQIVAHSSDFEKAIVKNVLGFEIVHENWYDTAAISMSHGGPRSLENCGAFWGLAIPKDLEGRKAMLKLARPRSAKNGERFWTRETAPKDFETLDAYCDTDVLSTAELFRKLAPMPEMERALYLLDQRMNFRGVPMDRPLIERVVHLLDLQEKDLTAELKKASGGALSSLRSGPQILEFLAAHNIDTHGKYSKDVLAPLLDDPAMPEMVKNVIQLRQSAGKSSNAKWPAMLALMDSSNRIMNSLIFAGATATARWAGSGAQFQNFPHGVKKEDEQAERIRDVMTLPFKQLKKKYKNLSDLFSSLLRSAILTEKTLYVSDFSSIEAVVAMWLAEDKKHLSLFENGGKLYEEMAAKIYSTPADAIGKESRERAVGKEAVLGSGYGMGPDKFFTRVLTGPAKINLADVECMRAAAILVENGVPTDLAPRLILRAISGVVNQGVIEFPVVAFRGIRMKRISNRTAEKHGHLIIKRGKTVIGEIYLLGMAEKVIEAYREEYHLIKDLWARYTSAALSAMNNEGKAYPVGPVAFRFRRGALAVRLPSGRVLEWHHAQIKKDVTPWGMETERISYLTSKNGKIIRAKLYGGKILENIDQATARDLMGAAIMRLEAAGFDPLLLVHDEGVSEAEEGRLEEYHAIMTLRESWFKTLPVKAGSGTGKRYRKF